MLLFKFLVGDEQIIDGKVLRWGLIFKRWFREEWLLLSYGTRADRPLLEERDRERGREKEFNSVEMNAALKATVYIQKKTNIETVEPIR